MNVAGRVIFNMLKAAKHAGKKDGDQIMKLTKARLREIIKEEMDMSPNIPTDEKGNLAWDSVELPEDLPNRVTSLWEPLNGLLKNWRPTELESIQYKKDLFILMDDFLKSPDRPSPGAPDDAV